MAGVRKKPNPGGNYHGWFVNFHGKQQFFTGTTNRAETRRIAQDKEREHKQIRLGYRPPPKSTERHRLRPYTEVRDEYLAWGKKQGGHNRRPWNEKHAHNRSVQLTWWATQ